MLSREQVYTMLMFREKKGNLFSPLPPELIQRISYFGKDLLMNEVDNITGSDIDKALRLAADGQEGALNELTAMLEEEPRLLLEAGNVKTRGGLLVTCTTILEFFITSLDPVAVARVVPYFSKFEGGEAQKENQFARNRPHIDALVKQIEAKLPAYDLRPLFNLLKKSPAADIIEALDINNSNREVTRNTPLRAEFAKFRKAVSVPTKKAAGMQYEHYTTLMQAFDLLFDEHEWKELTKGYANYDACDLAWNKIIGRLMDGLPHIGRFGFARAFNDDKRTLSYKYEPDNSFPDASSDGALTGLGFDFAIFGRTGGRRGMGWGVARAVSNFMSSNSFELAELMQPRRAQAPECVIL
jgi:hypothetical protein